ncbi:hypothetical protein RND71_028557 [Anisodus tanguticus]|uniref:Uncharacterized protein n=1 Tax=Anisodus tanguticus TaxID=243964 RepID=A0AAE1RIN0_9SOLA|nr:hypothetical protein RND71_028557 [Anisodus tanguticus]
MSMDIIMEDSDSVVSNIDAIIEDEYQQQISTAAGGGGADDLMIIVSSGDSSRSKNYINKRSQALGGHMGRHRDRAVIMNGNFQVIPDQLVRRSNSGRLLCLGLNLTPLENYDLGFMLGKEAPLVNLFL